MLPGPKLLENIKQLFSRFA